MLSLEWSENLEELARGDQKDIGQEQCKPTHLHPHKRIMDCPHDTFPQILWQNSLPIPEKHQYLRANQFLGISLCERYRDLGPQHLSQA